MDETTTSPQSKSTTLASLINHVHRFKKLLRTYWWIVLVTVTLSVAIELLLLWHRPPSFISLGRMIVNVKISLPDANLYSEELNNFFGTQEELMRSESVRNRVAQRLRSASSREGANPVQIKASLSAKTSIFNLLATGSDPKYTQDFLQATMEEYIKVKRELLQNAATSTRLTMSEDVLQLSAQLEESKRALLSYQASNSIVLLQSKEGNNAAEYLSSLTRQLAEHRSELQLLKTLTLDENLERKAGAFVAPGSEARSKGLVLSLTGDSPPESKHPASRTNSGIPSGEPSIKIHDSAEELLEHFPSKYGPLDSAYLEAKQQLRVLRAKQTEMSKVVAPDAHVLLLLNAEIAQQETLLSNFQEQSEQRLKGWQHTLELQIQDLEHQIEEWNLKALDASRKLAEFETLKENERRIQSMFDQMQTTLHSIDLEKSIRQESVTIFEPASTAIPLPPRLARHLVMSIFIGSCLGALVLLVLDRLDDRPSSFHELEELFPEPVLGQVQLIEQKGKNAEAAILQVDDDRHALVEAFSNIRSALMFMGVSVNHPRSIVVTSAIPGDGKSIVCASLAVSFAQVGARVLLVDADLRRGRLHRHFAVVPTPGFADVLTEQCPFNKAIVRTSTPNLHLLPCGARPPRPASLLVTSTEKFLEEVLKDYDYCFFDSAPVMAADDVSSLAPHVDGLIMVIRAGCTSGRIAKAALDCLYLRKVNVIGLVFNGVRARADDCYSYAYKAYYAPKQAA